MELDRTNSPDGLTEVTAGPFKNHRWAEPSVGSLRAAMRAVVEEPDVAELKGKRARQTMVEKYAPGRLADIVEGHLRRIEQLSRQDHKEL